MWKRKELKQRIFKTGKEKTPDPPKYQQDPDIILSGFLLAIKFSAGIDCLSQRKFSLKRKLRFNYSLK
ncbi:hypothetical protein GGQ94_002141 [Petrimonas sulfuriphila]